MRQEIRVVLIITVFILTCCGKNFAQVFKGEIIAGMNLTQLDGDRVVGYKKPGVHAGVGVLWSFDFRKNSEVKPWALSMEILYNQRGARQKNIQKDNKDTLWEISSVHFTYRLYIDYVSIPLMFSYTYKNRFSLGVGLSYNQLVRVKEIEFDVLQTDSLFKPFKKVDFDVLVDARVRLWQQLKLGFRFEYSIVPIRERYFPGSLFNPKTETRRQYHNTICLYLVYMFNEKRDNSRIERKKPEDKTYYY